MRRQSLVKLCMVSILAFVKCETFSENSIQHRRHHFDPQATSTRRNFGVSSNDKKDLASGPSLKRRRRFNNLKSSEEGSSMAFYRPTKILHSVAGHKGQPQPPEPMELLLNHPNSSNFVDKSDLLTLRSVNEVEEVGGISNIPGFSSSEEKLLEYSNNFLPSSSSTESTLTDDGGIIFDTEELTREEEDDKYESITAGIGDFEEVEEDSNRQPSLRRHHPRIDIVSKLLRIVETQALQGANCNPGTDLNLGEKVVNRYAQERFQQAAMIAVNMANWFTRMWKYAPDIIGNSEYLIHATLVSGVELTDDIFAFGNCHDANEYKNYFLFCPYAYRLPEGPILAKDLAIEYKYLSNTSEWFFIARKRAESVIQQGRSLKIGYHTYTYNSTAHTTRTTDKILTVKYEDGAWTKPYYDCGGGNIWMMTYTVPFFGFENGKYFFKGTSGIDIDLRRVDINQCPGQGGAGTLNIFGGTDKCKKETTFCEPITGLGFRRGSYTCMCKTGYYFPNTTADNRFFNGTELEEEYSKILEGEESIYEDPSAFQCLKCAEGCESCEDSSPCIVTLNWVLRTILLILQCVIIGCLPVVVLFTYKYKEIKVVRAASPVLLRIIILGAFFIYSTTIVLYPTPNIVTCTMRIWLREIGFALAYGALMLKTWRISVIFRVKSAKAVKITDMDLIKRLGLIVGIFVLCLLIRTLVSPPVVIVGRTSDHLKAFLCQSDWWDHSFTILEFLFLLWGIRLCIMVRKAPSEFNESRFISMTIYNEFLLSIFLNVSVFFLQHPANPDLLYIIFFCHSQLTISILLCLIFASKFYLVMKGHGKHDETSLTSKSGPGKFVTSKVRVAHNSLSQASNMPALAGMPNTTNPGSIAGLSTLDSSKMIMSDRDIQMELDKIFLTLQLLKERGSDNGSSGSKIAAIQEALKASTVSKSCLPTVNCENGPKKRPSVHLVNGQVVNSENIGPTTNMLQQEAPTSQLCKTAEHDSPVIVHQTEHNNTKTRVSFDLSRDDVTDIIPLAAVEAVEIEEEVFTSQTGPAADSSVSSCHSSKCCCSSYVCSVCSPQGSLENVQHDSACSSIAGVNSIDIASPRLQRKMSSTEEDLNLSKITQTDAAAAAAAAPAGMSAVESAVASSAETADDEEEEAAAAADEQHVKVTKKSNKGKRSQRIMINLDDKNRFTDEITV